MTEDLHDIFISELNKRYPKKVDLVDAITDILRLERESVYRRIAGKVNFSVREMGILAKALHMSLDSFLYKSEELQWLPFILESPLKSHSMETLCNIVEYNMQQVKEIAKGEASETGNIYNSLPLGAFVHSPLMLKFMFFKWGHYFVRSEDFNNFSRWELPERLISILKGYSEVYSFKKAFYIWDNSLVWSLAKEIENFYTMSIITEQEKNDIKNELKFILLEIERSLNGTCLLNAPLPVNTDFYVSSVNVGFSSCYYACKDQSISMFQTNFSFSMVKNSQEKFLQIKEWIESFRGISALLSQSGRIERRLFFQSQYQILDRL